jgi:UDP-N-acetylglucosamine--N-acetylmuramyl-(pentapeptide) pyrophosphoryl-undecaprenol N-acetylglucosamine transferase
MSRSLRVLLSGGGTAGHVAPALAVAAELQVLRPEVELLYVGTAEGLESELVSRAGLPFSAVKVQALSGRRALQAAGSLLRAAQAVTASRRLVRKFQPHVALGTGGYVAGPVLTAAWLCRVPTAIHEQNLRPGITNRLLARMVSEVYVSFEASRSHFPRPARTVVTGYPVRPEILAATREQSAQALGLDPARPTLLVAAGSRGARTISEAVKAGLPKLLRRVPRLQVVVSTGQAYYDDVNSALTAAGVVSGGADSKYRLLVYPYIHRMDYAYACADLVLCRAGGSTHELLARGLPSVLVPSPNVAYDQQADNARTLKRLGAAVVVEDRELTGDRFAQLVAELILDPERLQRMAGKAAAAGRPKAGRVIATRLLHLASSAAGSQRD